VAKQHFDALFKPNVGAQELVLNLIQINTMMMNNVVLTTPNTKEEIKQALLKN